MFNLDSLHSSWREIVCCALEQVDGRYLESLVLNSQWLPGKDKIFNAFNIPLTETRFILFGESPYPRVQSANGYAFWDNQINELWVETGLNKLVNKATSLRNFVKMLLIAENLLTRNDVSQEAVANIDKSALVTTVPELFGNLLKKGFLLLNASLVLRPDSLAAKNKDAQHWLPFVNKLLEQLEPYNRQITLLLFGQLAKRINSLQISQKFKKIQSVHPYNLDFLSDAQLIDLFSKLKLLKLN